MEIELKRVLRALRMSWWIPIVFALVFASLGYWVSGTMSKTYVASTQILALKPAVDSASITRESDQASTYLNLVKSGPVLDRVIHELDLPYTRIELEQQISVSVIPGTQIIVIKVTDKDPEMAAAIANATTRSFESQVYDLTVGQLKKNLDELNRQLSQVNDQITSIDARLAELDDPKNADDRQAQIEISTLKQQRLQNAQTAADLNGTIRELTSQLAMTTTPVTVVDTASVPEDPASPSRALNAALGFLVGGLLGCLVLGWREWMNNGVVDTADVAAALGAPVMSIPRKAIDSPTSALIRARVGGATENSDPLALVFPRQDANAAQFAESLQMPESSLAVANGLLDSESAVSAVSGVKRAIVVSTLDQTSAQDVSLTVQSLRDMGIEVISGIVRS